MSASKKSTAKSKKSPAPATKSSAASAARKKITTSRAAPVQTKTATPVAMLAPASAAARPAAVKVVPSKPVVTTISARVDVGFGNALFLRGEGPGLSWEKGAAMECAGRDLWIISLTESTRAYSFKFLINDASWSAGPDFSAACGTSVTLTPEF